MNKHLNLDLFVEDRAHEALLEPLLLRVAREEGIHVVPQVRTSRGGHARAIREFKAYQHLVEKRVFGRGMPDLLVVAIDGNCETFTQKKTEIARAATEDFRHMLVAACPDPHIERWFLADPDSFHEVVGYRPAVGSAQCERDDYMIESVSKGRDGSMQLESWRVSG